MVNEVNVDPDSGVILERNIKRIKKVELVTSQIWEKISCLVHLELTPEALHSSTRKASIHKFSFSGFSIFISSFFGLSIYVKLLSLCFIIFFSICQCGMNLVNLST